MSVHSIQPPDGPSNDTDTLVINEWKFSEDRAVYGLWGVAKALEQELHEPVENEVPLCLSIALVHLASQLKDAR